MELWMWVDEAVDEFRERGRYFERFFLSSCLQGMYAIYTKGMRVLGRKVSFA